MTDNVIPFPQPHRCTHFYPDPFRGGAYVCLVCERPKPCSHTVAYEKPGGERACALCHMPLEGPKT